MTLQTRILVLLASVSMAGSATAGYIAEDIPAWRGHENASYYNWESFTSADASTGPNFPSNESPPTGNALLFNFGEGAMISGDNNIYGYWGALNIHTYAYATQDVQAVVANISMHGTELLYDNVMLAMNDIDGASLGSIMGVATLNYWEEVDFGGGIGAIANVSYSFDLSGIDGDVVELGLIFATAGPHSSLDAVTLDFHVGSVPSAGGLALLGLAGFGRRRRR
ncbi:MAG TPA: hypothetical protein QF800_00390 [Phycisphaerales bacterium]|nr:hypothetical protein [Phycisphaerales bacterium]